MTYASSSEPLDARRIVFTTHGTIGSVEPMLGLAQLLSQRGHNVELAAPEPLASRASKLVKTHTLTTKEPEPPLGYFGEHNKQVGNNLRLQCAAVPEYFAQLRDLCKGADAFIAFPFQLAAPMVKEVIDAPYISLHFSPFAGMGSKQMIAESADIVNPIRQQLGLRAVEDPLGNDAVSDELALYAVSSHLFRRPRKWPDNKKVTGYFFSQDNTPPDDALRRFMESGEKPIVVTMGSVRHQDPAAVTEIFVEAARRLGRRMVIQRGWSGLGHEIDVESIHVAKFVPHAWLFPRAAAIVHAGGAGTTGAALRSGVPAVVVPHLLDQPMWASLVRSARCGLAVPFPKLDADAIVEALAEVLENTKYQDAAKVMSENIEAEDGTAAAADLVEDLLRKGTRRSSQ